MKILLTILILGSMLFISCVYIGTRVEAIAVDKLRENSEFVIEKPTKAHLRDGSVVLDEAGRR